MMFLTDLLDRLEDLRISDSDFLEKMKQLDTLMKKLTICLIIVYKQYMIILEGIYLNETIYLILGAGSEFSM